MRDKLNLQLLILLLVFSIILLTLSARGCSKRKRETKIGSSVPEWAGIDVPSNLIATFRSSFQIDISWNDNSYNEDGFAIERKIWNNGNWSEIQRVGINSVGYSDITTTGFTPFVIYYRVRAYNNIGDYSDYSNEVVINTLLYLSWADVTAGGNHIIARTTEGVIWSWGRNTFGQLGLGDANDRYMPYQIGIDTDWQELTAGDSHTIALKNNGTMWAWGYNGNGQLGTGNDIFDESVPVQVGTETDWTSVVAGGYHSLGLKSNGSAQPPGGTIWSWGYNVWGQLGLGDSGEGTQRVTPTQIDTASDWIEITAGGYHSVARKTDNTLWSWGENSYGQLGDGTGGPGVFRTTPRLIGTDSDWSNITAGNGVDTTLESFFGGTTFAFKTDNTLWSWGFNVHGQLGLGDCLSRNTPAQLPGTNDWSIITAGDNHTIALKNDGSIWSWGYNIAGQLGLGDSGRFTSRNTPTKIGTDTDWSIINASNGIIPDGGEYIGYSIAIKTNGTIWSCGYNSYGQLGLGDNADRNTLTQIIFVPNPPSFLTAQVVSPPGGVNLSWSDNSYNEAGFKIERKIGRTGTYEQIAEVVSDVTTYSDNTGFPPSSTYYYYRVKAYNDFGESGYTNEYWVANSGNWSMVNVGVNYNVAFKTNGTIWTWGNNGIGQLGLGDIISRNIPTSVDSATDWSSVEISDNHTIAHKLNGTLWSWGYNALGQLGVGDTIMRTTPSQIGNATDWLAVSGTNLSTVIPAVNYNIALKNDGSIWSWGYNIIGQLGLGDTINRTTPTQIGNTSDWIKFTTGPSHVIAQKTNNTIWSWGNNQNGQLGLGYTSSYEFSPTRIDSSTDWFTVKAVSNHTIGLKTGGTLWSWGNNQSGQLGLAYTSNIVFTPSQIGNATDWISVTLGNDFTIGLKNSGLIWSWGRNDYGQLGLGYTSMTMLTPTQIGNSTDWSIVTVGTYHIIALRNNGTLWAWGNNSLYGQLGLGDMVNRDIPTQIGSATDWTNVITKVDFTIASKNNPPGGEAGNTIWAWGSNGSGQLGLGDYINRNIPTLVGE